MYIKRSKCDMGVSVTKEMFNGKEAVYVSPTERRELAKSVTQSHIRFNEKLEDMGSSHKLWFKPFQLENVNQASILSELNCVNSNRPRVFQEMFHTLDYLDERNKHFNYINSAPKDQYQRNIDYNLNMKQDEQYSHAFKTPQPIKRSVK